eukprot:m.280361 g.280361  ORF g.280361 m.280361 type:complete len:341 (-) comp16164_c1_seq2:16-1038(-)
MLLLRGHVVEVVDQLGLDHTDSAGRARDHPWTTAQQRGEESEHDGSVESDDGGHPRDKRKGNGLRDLGQGDRKPNQAVLVEFTAMLPPPSLPVPQCDPPSCRGPPCHVQKSSKVRPAPATDQRVLWGFGVDWSLLLVVTPGGCHSATRHRSLGHAAIVDRVFLWPAVGCRGSRCGFAVGAVASRCRVGEGGRGTDCDDVRVRALLQRSCLWIRSSLCRWRIVQEPLGLRGIVRVGATRLRRCRAVHRNTHSVCWLFIHRFSGHWISSVARSLSIDRDTASSTVPLRRRVSVWLPPAGATVTVHPPRSHAAGLRGKGLCPPLHVDWDREPGRERSRWGPSA